MQLCKYSAAAVSFWENSQPQQFFCISFDFISFCSEDVNWDCCGLFWTLETGMRQSLFLYTIHSCWMRIIQLCFKLYLKSIGDRSLGFLFSFFFFFLPLLGTGHSFHFSVQFPPIQCQWSEVFMNFLCVPVMKHTFCKLFFFPPLLFQIYITGCHCQLSTWQIASVMYSNRCVIFVFLAFVLQFSTNILYICISVWFKQV